MRSRLEVGVLELLAGGAARGAARRLLARVLVRQYASIAPQWVAVWARRLGHHVTYATYEGIGDPLRLVPPHLDVLFVACHSQASPLAYALARLHRRRGTRTVLGGPHARAFPADALRFFDVVVGDCDAELVGRILAGDVPAGQVVTAGRAPRQVPSLAERMPEIGRSWLRGGSSTATVGLLASLGCPYTCDFCVDARSVHRVFPPEALAEDLRWAADALPGVRLAFHDPNFAVRFDETLDVMERVTRRRRNPWVMQSSLSVLTPGRVPRLGKAGCRYVAPSVESWEGYGDKTGVGRRRGRDKLEAVLSRLEALRPHVPGVQVNFVTGLDEDDPDGSLELTLEFVRRAPWVVTTATIASAYGGTPLHERLRRQGRLLERMPPALLYTPFLSAVPREGDPRPTYRRIERLFGALASPGGLARRVRGGVSGGLLAFHALRAMSARDSLAGVRQVRRLLDADRQALAFHSGDSTALPAFHQHWIERQLGPFAELLPPADRIPVLDPVPAAAVHAAG